LQFVSITHFELQDFICFSNYIFHKPIFKKSLLGCHSYDFIGFIQGFVNYIHCKRWHHSLFFITFRVWNRIGKKKKGWHAHSIEKDCNIKVFENNNHVHLKIYVRLECNVTCPNIVCTHYLFYQKRPTIYYKFTMTLLMFGPPQDDNVRSCSYTIVKPPHLTATLCTCQGWAL
jgi:hypothetical protein